MCDAEDAHHTLTFVVRLWREAAGNGQERWRGRVEHVGTQEVGYVEGMGGVAKFMARWIRPDEEGMPGTSVQSL